MRSFARPDGSLKILSHSLPDAVVFDRSPLGPVNHRSSAVSRSAIAVLPALDSRWVGAEGGGVTVALIIGLAVIAIVALLVAGAAYHSDPKRRRRSSADDEELFTTTPLPMPKEELARMARERRHDAFTGLSIPRWVQVGSLVVALGTTWIVANRIRGRGADENAEANGGPPRFDAAARRDEADDSPEDLDLRPDSAPTFAFRARDWITRGSGCAGLLEVTKGEGSAWTLTARVHNDQGRLIDTARTRVSSLRAGDVVEFRFARATCDEIGAWDVRGSRQDR